MDTDLLPLRKKPKYIQTIMMIKKRIICIYFLQMVSILHRKLTTSPRKMAHEEVEIKGAAF
jgi:hypothetical protein